MRKVEAQPLRRIQRAGLFYVRSQNVSQRRIHEMRARVIPDNPRPPLRIRHNGHAIPDAKRLLRNNFMRHESRNGIIRTLDLCKQLRLRIVVERAGVRYLPPRFCINHGAVQNNLAALSRIQFVNWPHLRDDRFNPAIFRARPKIKVQLRRESVRDLRIRRICRLFPLAFPRRPATLALLPHGQVKSFPIDAHTLEPGRVLDHISSKTEGVVKPKGHIAWKRHLVNQHTPRLRGSEAQRFH